MFRSGFIRCSAAQEASEEVLDAARKTACGNISGFNGIDDQVHQTHGAGVNGAGQLDGALDGVAHRLFQLGRQIIPAAPVHSSDGEVYGLPTHVGATVAFYNTELLEAAGIDYTTIKTWDDFKEAGSKYYDATGKYLGTADTGSIWTESLMISELGSDYTDDKGNPQIDTPEMEKVLTTLKDLQDSNAIATIAGGQPDNEEAFGEYNNGNYACAIMPMWYMSRFINYMPELSGKIAIAPAPVFEEGQDRSVGGGGTGTVVTNQCESKDLAKEFLAFAKLSEEGNIKVWEILGFDPVNTAVWDNEEVTNNPDNQYVQYFQNNPFDVLKEIRDEIGLCKVVANSPSINEVFCTTTLNSIFEDGESVQDALDYAKDEVDNAIQ